MIIIETGDRLARDRIVQELGIKQLEELEMSIVCADNPKQFSDPSPTAKLIRQLMGSIYTFVASQIKQRMSSGYNKAKVHVESYV